MGLPPHAWAAVTVDNKERIWVIGGVTQNCASDSLAVILESGKWSTVALPPTSSIPPRRRQARAITTLPGLSAITNLPTSNIWVWGGIAEPYTCSFDTVIGGVITLYLKKKAADHAIRDVQQTSDIDPNGPPVSALTFTRPVVKRSLSLGSTINEKEEDDLASMASPASVNTAGSVTSYPAEHVGTSLDLAQGSARVIKTESHCRGHPP